MPMPKVCRTVRLLHLPTAEVAGSSRTIVRNRVSCLPTVECRHPWEARGESEQGAARRAWCWGRWCFPPVTPTSLRELSLAHSEYGAGLWVGHWGQPRVTQRKEPPGEGLGYAWPDCALVSAALGHWRCEGRVAVWLCVPILQSQCIGPASSLGFRFHHAEGDTATLSLWLAEGPSRLPAFATHQVGVAGSLG